MPESRTSARGAESAARVGCNWKDTATNIVCHLFVPPQRVLLVRSIVNIYFLEFDDLSVTQVPSSSRSMLAIPHVRSRVILACNRVSRCNRVLNLALPTLARSLHHSVTVLQDGGLQGSGGARLQGPTMTSSDIQRAHCSMPPYFSSSSNMEKQYRNS